MAHLYVDITRLIDRRDLTGIPRVMNELATRFLQRDNCTVISWNGESYTPVSKKTFDAWQQSRRVTGGSPSRIPSALARLLDRMVSKVKRRLTSPNFQTGDVLLVAWGVWHNERYISELERLHRLGVGLIEIAYDMVPLVAPQYFSNTAEVLERYARRIYPLCRLIFAISEHTRDDVKRWLANQCLPAPPVEVVRLGEDFQATTPMVPINKHFTESGLKGNDYILCVGTIEPRKNHTLLLYAYKLASQRNIALPKLVIVGRRGWMSDAIYSMMTTDPEIKDLFVLQDNINDEELSWLYGNCLFSIYPSFYEGWGLPIAESMAHGAPCIASNTSSIPEIAGDLIGYFSPASTDECLAAIRHLLQPAELEKARQRVRGYRPTPWDETFKSVDEQIEALL